MLEDISRDDLCRAVDHAVEDLLTAAGVSAPPVDAVAVARGHLGLTIREDDRPRRRASKIDARQELVLPPGLSAEQTQLAVARAIGAERKPAILCGLGIPPDQQRGLLGASPAELFADRLLMPTAWFSAAVRELDYDVPQLQQRFSTASPEAVADRLLDLPEPCVIAIVSNGVVVRRRSNAWRVNRTLAPAECECQRLVEQQRAAQVVRADGWTVRGWPNGTRVILRSIVDE